MSGYACNTMWRDMNQGLQQRECDLQHHYNKVELCQVNRMRQTNNNNNNYCCCCCSVSQQVNNKYCCCCCCSASQQNAAKSKYRPIWDQSSCSASQQVNDTLSKTKNNNPITSFCVYDEDHKIKNERQSNDNKSSNDIERL